MLTNYMLYLYFVFAGQFFASTMFLISISTAMNVFVLNINERGKMEGRPVPRWLRILVFDYLAILCCVDRRCPTFFSKRPPRRNSHGTTDQMELRYNAATHNNHNMSGTSGLSNPYMPQRESVISNTGGRNVRFSTGGTSYGENDILLDDRQDRFAEIEGVGERRLARVERAVEAILKHLKSGQKRKEKADRQKSDWSKVAKVLDRILMLLFVCCTAATSLTLMLRQSPFKPPPDMSEHDIPADLGD